MNTKARPSSLPHSLTHMCARMDLLTDSSGDPRVRRRHLSLGDPLRNLPLSRWPRRRRRGTVKASVLMQRLSCPTETVSSNKITRNRIVLSFKDSPRKPLGQRPVRFGGDERMDERRNCSARGGQLLNMRPPYESILSTAISRSTQ